MNFCHFGVVTPWKFKSESHFPRQRPRLRVNLPRVQTRRFQRTQMLLKFTRHDQQLFNTFLSRSDDPRAESLKAIYHGMARNDPKKKELVAQWKLDKTLSWHVHHRGIPGLFGTMVKFRSSISRCIDQQFRPFRRCKMSASSISSAGEARMANPLLHVPPSREPSAGPVDTAE